MNLYLHTGKESLFYKMFHFYVHFVVFVVRMPTGMYKILLSNPIFIV